MEKFNKKYVFVALFFVMTVLIGLLFTIKTGKNHIDKKLAIGTTASLNLNKDTSQGGVSDVGVIESGVLCVTIDNKKGYAPASTNAENAAVKYYKDWLPSLGYTDNGFMVLPTSSALGGGASTQPFDNNIGNRDQLSYGWYDASSRQFKYFQGDDWNYAIVGYGLEPKNVEEGIFRAKLTETFQSGGMSALTNWKTLFADNEATYTIQSQQLWRHFAGTGLEGGVEDRIAQYMKLDGLDLNDIGSWTAEEKEKAFISYFDLLLTCRYAVNESGQASEAWDDILNGYLAEGPGVDYSNYNLVIFPGISLVKGMVTGKREVICTSVMDVVNYVYQIQSTYTLSDKVGDKLVSGFENTGGTDGLYNQIQTSISSNVGALNMLSSAYPINNDTWRLMTVQGLNRLYNFTTNQLEYTKGTVNLIEPMFLQGTDGVKYYGKILVLGIPLATSTKGLESSFKVLWAADGGNYIQLPNTSENIGDTAQFYISLKCKDTEKAAWNSICDTYENFSISFDLKSDATTNRKSETTKKGGVTSNLNQPEYTVDGAPYTVNKEISIDKETLRKLIMGEIQFTRLYDKSTNTQPITMKELQTFGYNLNVTIHYSNKDGKGGSYTTPWTGWQYDTSSKQKENHQVSAFREEENATVVTWYSEPEAFAEVKQGTVEYQGTGANEEFEAMAGVPSTEMLYFASGGSEFIVELELEYIEGEDGYRQYKSSYTGTECEFKHQDGFWEMDAKDGTEKYKEHDRDENQVSQSVKTNTAELQTGEHIIEKRLVADNKGYDTEFDYNSKTPVQWYQWAVPGTGTGTNGTTASVNYNVKLNGHTHAWGHDNTEGDKEQSASTVKATWTGTISNQTTEPSDIGTFNTGQAGPECDGIGATEGSLRTKATPTTNWDISGYNSALEQAIAWAKAYEETDKTYTAKMLADSDDYTRVWRIGDATIKITLSGGDDAGTNGTKKDFSPINGATYTTKNANTKALKTTDKNILGDGWNWSDGILGIIEEGSEGCGHDCDDDSEGHECDHECGSFTAWQDLQENTKASDIKYVIDVTFANGTLDAHELCGTCCQHDLPIVGDYWTQQMKYDYAQLNVCRVYKIYRSYVDGMEEITFANYDDNEDLADGDDYLMYSGPINNYTIDTGAFASEDRFFNLGVTDKKRARQVISAADQSKKHNGTDTIVAAINQGDPNIFYNIAKMCNIDDDYALTYANEIENDEPTAWNSFAGRTRYSLVPNLHHDAGFMEFTQRGDYSAMPGTTGLTAYPASYGAFMGSRSNKCDGLSKTVGGTNQIKVSANGHAKPTVTLGGESGKWFSTYNAGKSTNIPNFSNGLLYSRSADTLHSGVPIDWDAEPVTYYYDKSKTVWYPTTDEWWMGMTKVSDDYSSKELLEIGTVEKNGGGVLNGGNVEYANFDKENNAAPKTKYSSSSIDAIDYQTEEYHRMRFRRNMKNTLYVISDMLVLQTSTGDQPVMYHWKSQSKRTQQHYDYTISDVDLKMAQLDPNFTGTTITLKESFDDMWLNQKSGDMNANASSVTSTVNGWGINNVGNDGEINVGGYLGLYDQPDRKYSSGSVNNLFGTLFDSFGGGSGSQEGPDREAIADDVMLLQYPLSVNFPLVHDYYYDKSPWHVGPMDFGGNKADIAEKIDPEGWSYTGAACFEVKKFNSFSDLHGGPQNVWRYATTVDNTNPDMYKSMPGAHGANWGETGGNSWRASGLRMDRPGGALRVVTDMIQQDPTNPNKEYQTGDAVQTYMRILDWPKTDIGDMNYIDITKDSYGYGRPGNVHRFDFERKNGSFKIKFFEEDVYATDEDRVDKEGEVRFTQNIKPNTATILDGYTIGAGYSKQDPKVNNIVVYNPISVEEAVITHNKEAETNSWYSDTRTSAEDLTTTALQDKLDKLNVCSGDPDTCAFKVLHCVYDEDEVVFSSDFDTLVNQTKGTVQNLVGQKETYQLPSGFAIQEGIKRINPQTSKEYWYSPFESGKLLKCFGTRWSLPLSNLGITYSQDTRIKVDFDFYMDDTKTDGTMVVSFNNYDFYIPGGQYNAIPTWNTGNGWERKYPTVNLYDKELKISLIFDFGDVYKSDLYVNGKKITNVEIVNNSSTITSGMIGNSINIGSWMADDSYPAQFYMDNLTITKLAGGREHTDACYQIVKEHQKAQQYTCGISYTFTYGTKPDATTTNGRPYVFRVPQTGVYRVEAWGASGGGATINQGAPSAGGLGGYTRGYVTLEKGEELMIYPGGSGGSTASSGLGYEYFWVLRPSGCGQSDAWNADHPETMSGINYINSVSGKQEVTNGTMHGVWSTSLPSGYVCGAHSVSVAVNNATGQMIKRIPSAGSGSSGNTTTFNYTGTVQTFVAPVEGDYILEAWGASGGDSAGNTGSMSGLGGYTKGTTHLKAGQTLYVYVGETGKGNIKSYAFNGGGPQSSLSHSEYGGRGGGATDFRLVNGSWDNTSGLQSRILVAGGGGGQGCASAHNRGNGGGLTGAGTLNSSGTYALAQTVGATQTAGGYGANTKWFNSGHTTGSFGKGAMAAQCAAGGGGGYYGGGSEYTAGGSGGSSYVTGYTGCDTTYRAKQGGFTFKNVTLQQGVNTGNGVAKVTRLAASNSNTFGNAGFNGGGAGGPGGYGGGGASDVRRITSGGHYVLSGSTDAGLQTMEYGGKTYVKVFSHDSIAGGYFTSKSEAQNCNTTGKFSILSSIDKLKASGKYQFMLVYPDVNKRNIWKQTNNPLNENIADTTTGKKVAGYEAVNISMSSNYWGGLALSTTNATLLDGSVGHSNWHYAIGATQKWPVESTQNTFPGASGDVITKAELWLVCDEDTVAELNGNKVAQPKMSETGTLTYGPYVDAVSGSYQVDIYGKGLADCTFDVYANQMGGVIYNNNQLLDLKISPTHVSFYFDLPYNLTETTNTGLEVRVHHDGVPEYTFEASYISRLEDRFIVAGGGGGADDGGGTAGGANDGSGGYGGGEIAGNAKVEGQLTKPGVALTTALQPQVDLIKDKDHGSWKAIEGIAMSGCGLGGGQDYGYALGRGESVSFTTDTGGAGGGYFGGYVTNHNNGGAGGGSSYIEPGATEPILANNSNNGDGKVRLGLVSHENREGLSQTFGYTGAVQEWIVPESGEYRLEVWGASGGDGREVNTTNIIANTGGKGGYTTGVYSLTAGQKVYLYVGGQGEANSSTAYRSFGKGGWNGGGNGGTDNDGTYPESGAGGGGMSHISFSNEDDVVKDKFDTTSLLLLAGGGGGAGSQYGTKQIAFGGPAGGVKGKSYNEFSKPGTQSSGYLLGRGQDGISDYGSGFSSGAGTGGNGAGYYGGYWASGSYTSDYGLNDRVGGAGGSGYINTTRIRYGQLVDGDAKQPSPTDKDATQIGNKGNGYARITKLNRSHNATCTFINSEYNYHAHNENCLSLENDVLRSALNNEYSGNPIMLRELLGESVYTLLKKESTVYSYSGFTQTNFQGFMADIYENGGIYSSLTSDKASGDVSMNGDLIIQPLRADSWVGVKTDIAAGAVTKITAKVKFTGHIPSKAQIFWENEYGGFSSGNSATVAVDQSNTGYQTLTWYLDGTHMYNADGTAIPNTDFTQYKRWKGTIKKIRFDFYGDNTDTINDRVYLKDVSLIGSGTYDSSSMQVPTNFATLDFTTNKGFGAYAVGNCKINNTSEGLNVTGRFYGDEVVVPMEVPANTVQFVQVTFKAPAPTTLDNTFRLWARDENNTTLDAKVLNVSYVPWKNQRESQTVTFYVGDAWKGHNIKDILLDVALGDTVQNGNVYIENIKLFGYGSVKQLGIGVNKVFNYTGETQFFTIPETAEYTIELYGAAGGGTLHGKGGYVKGKKTLTAGTNLAITVGGAGQKNNSTVYNYGYTGGVQTFTAPVSGQYRLEVFGAQGANDQGANTARNQGGYSAGFKYLKAGEQLYIVVGCAGNSAGWTAATSANEAYNGGGRAGGQTGNGGGGATHIAITNRGVLSNYNSYRNEVLIVAGGGGGAGDGSWGGPGGGSSGLNGAGASGATGSSGYSFGRGQNAGADQSQGGGGGWFGGYSTYSMSGAGGGSGYIGGVTNGSMANGMRAGHGYARITLVSDSTSSGYNGGGSGGTGAFGGGGASDIATYYTANATNGVGSVSISNVSTSGTSWVQNAIGSWVHLHTNHGGLKASSNNKIWRVDVFGSGLDKNNLTLCYHNGTTWIGGGATIVSSRITSNHAQYFVKATTNYPSLAFCFDHVLSGSTTITQVTFTDMSDRIAVAGGGGGSADYVHGETYAGNQGGNGGGTTGGSGNIEGNDGSSHKPATGGTQTSGGTGAVNTISYPNNGEPGGFGYGGNGISVNGHNGGGAGSGYYGGGSGTGWYQAGGAGGSSYVTGLSEVTNQQGVREGNGYVKISAELPTIMTSTSGIQILKVKYASSFAGLDGTEEGLKAAVKAISAYTDGKTNNVGPTIPRYVNGVVNPIYYCFEYGYNVHDCTKSNGQCDKETKVLKCVEPHHMGLHYETTADAVAAKLAVAQQSAVNIAQQKALADGRIFTEDDYNTAIAEATANFDATGIHSCYEACNNDDNHRTHQSTTVVNGNKIGDLYINTDEYFDIRFPNEGDFYESNLYGIPSTVKTRGKGYTINMDTSKWTREKYVKFDFDVLFYRAETGLWEQYLADSWIELPVEGVNNDAGYQRNGEGLDSKHDGGYSIYHFYCTLNNNEASAAKVVFEAEAINAKNSNGKYVYKDKFDFGDDLTLTDKQTHVKSSKSARNGVTCNYNVNEGAPYHWKTIGTYPVGYGIGNRLIQELCVHENQLITESGSGGGRVKNFLYRVKADRNDRVINNPASNHRNDNDNHVDPTNGKRRNNLTSTHGATVTKYVDVVGRIGNLLETSTTDIRFMNLFKVPDPSGTYLINGVVKEVLEDVQNDYLSWHWNSGALAYDVRHRQVDRKTAMYNTWGSSMWKGASLNDETDVNNSGTGAAQVVQEGKDPSSLPLASDRNNIEVYKDELLKPGYTINYEITTKGNYADQFQVKPYFYAMDLDTGKITPVDVYMKTDEDYKAINLFGYADRNRVDNGLFQNKDINGNIIEIYDYILSLDWKNEAKLRMYTKMEEELTKAIHDNYIEMRADDESGNQIIDTSKIENQLKPEPVRIPSGDFFKLGNLQAQIITNQARTFLGTRYTMYEDFPSENHILHNTNLAELVDDLEYTWMAQRWHLKLGLPSSAVFTLYENGKHYRPLDDKVIGGNKVKAFEEVQNGNYAILMTANLKAIGHVWNLYYTQEANNGVFTIGGKRYTINTNFNEFTTGRADDVQVLLAVYDNNITSKVDVETIGTH